MRSWFSFVFSTISCWYFSPYCALKIIYWIAIFIITFLLLCFRFYCVLKIICWSDKIWCFDCVFLTPFVWFCLILVPPGLFAPFVCLFVCFFFFFLLSFCHLLVLFTTFQNIRSSLLSFGSHIRFIRNALYALNIILSASEILDLLLGNCSSVHFFATFAIQGAF